MTEVVNGRTSYDAYMDVNKELERLEEAIAKLQEQRNKLLYKKMKLTANYTKPSIQDYMELEESFRSKYL